MTKIPVIDLFAGPGGLSEGFARFGNYGRDSGFEIKLSIEKDEIAHKTLELRAFFRSFEGRAPDAYYDYATQEISKDTLFNDPRYQSNLKHARNEAWHHTLAEETHPEVSKRVRHALGNANDWVLIGGPPCQAYSLVGRSRMRSTDPLGFEKDARHFLYREYLQILAEHAPPVFIMENVKGLLSSTMKGRSMFGRILDDLSRPNGDSLRYRVVPLSGGSDLFNFSPEDYVIRCERFGVPQARHRVILCGIREDIHSEPGVLTASADQLFTDNVLNDLPPLRSRLSDSTDSHREWLKVLADTASRLEKLASFRDVRAEMAKSLRRARLITDVGQKVSLYVHSDRAQLSLFDWYRDKNLNGVANHASRSHMPSDVQRYFFAAAFAAARGNVSPKLSDFPKFLLPEHRNIRGHSALDTPFNDRFRVQAWGRPSTTIVSHISKDGHYYIHPDPAQCRSLSVREAARLQTFPDNYCFEGNRTHQYHQVGNAVPPLIAKQIAQTVSRTFLSKRANRTKPKAEKAATILN